MSVPVSTRSVERALEVAPLRIASVFTAPGAAAYAKPNPIAVTIKEIGIMLFLS